MSLLTLPDNLVENMWCFRSCHTAPIVNDAIYRTKSLIGVEEGGDFSTLD